MTATNVSYPLAVGIARGKGASRGDPGAFTTPIFRYLITPVAVAANNVATAQAIAGAANAVLNGTLVSGGIATLDVARGIQLVSANAGDTTQTVTLYGTDYYNVPLVETVSLNGTTIVYSKKTFKTITRAAVSAAMAGNLTLGTSDIFGLPYGVAGRYDAQTWWDTAFVTTGTFTGAVTTNPATATTGDTRGTYFVPSASDGTKKLSVWIVVQNPDSSDVLYGVDQYSV